VNPWFWVAIAAAFSLWAYWPRLMDRIHDHSEHREYDNDGDTEP
jgi:hypothetical protein